MINIVLSSEKQKLKQILLNNLEDFENLRAFSELYPKDILPKRFDKNTALMLAISNKDFAMVKYLIEKKANVNFMNGSPLYIACYENCLNTAKYLIEQGADIRLRTYGCFRAACVKGNLDVIKYLVETYNINVSLDDGFGLRWTRAKGFTDCVKYLISKGA